VKNRGWEVLLTVSIKTFPLFFTGQSTPLTKLFPYFLLLFSIFQSTSSTKPSLLQREKAQKGEFVTPEVEFI